MPRRIHHVTLTPTPAADVEVGARVRFTYHGGSTDVRQAYVTTCNGQPAVYFKCVDEETSEVYVAPDQTVWVVTVVRTTVEVE